MVSPFQPEAEKVAAIRALIPATRAGIYLNTGTAGPISSETAAAMREMDEWQVRVGRCDPDEYDSFMDRLAECRAVLAAMVSGDLEGVGLVHGTTEAMNHALLGLDWRLGDRLITTDQEHPGLSGPIWTVSERFGVEADVVEAGDGDPARIIEAIRAALTPRTRMIALSHVLWSTGAVMPMEAIADVAQAHGAWLVIDAAQSVGAIPVDVDRLRPDVIGFAGQKWLGGPVGTGGAWASPRARTELLTSWSGYPTFADASALPRAATPWPTGQRFEWGDAHRPSVVGLARAVGWLQMYVGLPWAFERAGRLARTTAERLAAIDGVTVLTPLDRMATLVTFRVGGWSSEEVRVALVRRVHAMTRTIPSLDALRLSINYFNTDEELDRLIEAVSEVARHAPSTLPQRQELFVVSADGEQP